MMARIGREHAARATALFIGKACLLSSLSGCVEVASVQPPTEVAIPSAVSKAPAPLPLPPRAHRKEKTRSSLSAAGLTLVPHGSVMLEAYASVTGPHGSSVVVKDPQVDFFFSDRSSSRWEPIPGCLGVSECKLYPISWRSGVVGAVFSPADPSIPAVASLLHYSAGSWSP